jgi:hypothetical protein
MAVVPYSFERLLLWLLLDEVLLRGAEAVAVPAAPGISTALDGGAANVPCGLVAVTVQVIEVPASAAATS